MVEMDKGIDTGHEMIPIAFYTLAKYHIHWQSTPKSGFRGKPVGAYGLILITTRQHRNHYITRPTFSK